MDIFDLSAPCVESSLFFDYPVVGSSCVNMVCTILPPEARACKERRCLSLTVLWGDVNQALRCLPLGPECRVGVMSLSFVSRIQAWYEVMSGGAVYHPMLSFPGTLFLFFPFSKSGDNIHLS